MSDQNNDVTNLACEIANAWLRNREVARRLSPALVRKLNDLEVATRDMPGRDDLRSRIA